MPPPPTRSPSEFSLCPFHPERRSAPCVPDIRPRSDSATASLECGTHTGSQPPPAFLPRGIALPASAAPSPCGRVPLLPLPAALPDNSDAIASLSPPPRPVVRTARPTPVIVVAWHTAGSRPLAWV